MNAFWFELRLAVRALLRSPGSALTAIAMLAAGLGACLYMYGAVHAFLLRPLPLPEPDRLVHLEYAQSGGFGNVEPSLADFVAFERADSGLETLAAFYRGTVNLSGDAARPERLDGAYMTASGFAAFGIAPLLGRTYGRADEEPGAERVVVIGFQLWQSRFAGDPGIVGREIRINGRPATIVGVMPEGFRFPFNDQIWVPLERREAALARGAGITVDVFGRLRPDVSLEQAGAALQAQLTRLNEAHPGEVGGDLALLKAYQAEFVGRQTQRVLGVLLVATLLVLLIACANVAQLLLARGIARTRDLAVRNALGASRSRLAFGMAAEALLVALLALPLAVIGAWLGGDATMAAVRNGGDPPPFWMTEWRLELSFLGVAFLLALASGSIAGLLPGLRLARMATAQVIREGGDSGGARAIGRGLIVAEIAMSVALLVAAGLMVRGTLALQSFDPGARIDGILTARLGLFESTHPDDRAVLDFQARLQRELLALPGVRSASLASNLPMGNSALNTAVAASGQVIADPAQTPLAFDVRVGDDYFRTFEVPLLAGRLFDRRDHGESPPVVIVSRAYAERTWPGQDPIGRTLWLDRADRAPSALLTVIGVVGDVAQSGSAVIDRWAADRPAVYRPLAQVPTRFVSIAIAAGEPPGALAGALREAVARVDADTPVYWLTSLQQALEEQMVDHRLIGILLATFGLFSLVLAASGLYAMLAFAVNQRTREIGVRRALGASAGAIVAMVAGQGFRQLALGLALGLVLALGFGSALSAFLFEVSGTDPLSYAMAVLAFALVAVLASVLPARRALAVEPMEALRHA